MPNYIMMIGLPGSGKSTISKLFQAEAVLSTDDYVEAIAQTKGLTYNDVWDTYIGEATKVMEERFVSATMNSLNILHDQTNLTVKKRAAMLRRVPAAYTKIAVVVETSHDVWEQRLWSRVGKTIPKYVLDGMVKSCQRPELSEGFDRIYYVTT